MVDLSRHLQHADKAIKNRNYDLAIQVCLQCQEVDPTSLENYGLLLDASRRRTQEGGKKGMLAGLSTLSSLFSKDPLKKLSAAVKAMAQGPDEKALAAVADAARESYEGGNKPMAQVAIFFYEEVRKSGLFNEKVLWNSAQTYQALFQASKDPEMLEKAVQAMAELKRNMPAHPEAGRTLQNWEALRSMTKRTANTSQDYRSQLASSSEAKKNEALGRVIRTREDAEEVLKFVDEDLQKDPRNKQMWQKKGDVLRRIADYARAKEAYQKAMEIDSHDFNLVIAIGDCDMAAAKVEVERLKKAGENTDAALAHLRKLEISEYRKRVERQPTEARHRYHLGQNLFATGDIDGAAAELQKAIGDARYKRSAHRLLGMCFVKKGLNELAADQFSSYLKLTDDDYEDEAKDVRYNRGRLYESIGKKDLAGADYRRLVEIDISFKDAADRLGKLG